MAKDPAFLFYTNDFSSGTQFFTDEQLGIYLRLLMAQHQHGHLSEKQVNFICKSYDKDILIKFEKDENGMFFNKRLDEEIFKRKRFTESRSNNKSGRKKALNEENINSNILITSKSYDLSYDNHMENENRNRNRDINKEELEKVIKKKKETEPPLVFPYESEKFKIAWAALMLTKKWKPKLNYSLQLSLDKLKKYDEEFSILMIEEATEKGWQGLEYENTPEKYQKYLNNKNGIKNGTTDKKFGIDARLERGKTFGSL